MAWAIQEQGVVSHQVAEEELLLDLDTEVELVSLVDVVAMAVEWLQVMVL